MKFRLKCQQAHRLSIESMDRKLGWFEALRLRAHLAACDACTTVSAQMRLLRGAMQRLGEAGEAPAQQGAVAPRRDAPRP